MQDGGGKRECEAGKVGRLKGGVQGGGWRTEDKLGVVNSELERKGLDGIGWDG